MARKRMIDPSIWTDDGMAELTPRQQLLYIGFISNADDEGRLKGNSVAIRLMFPGIYGEVSIEEIDADVEAVLDKMRKLRRYYVDNRPYLIFDNYRTWQVIQKAKTSVLPAPIPEPDDTSTVPVQDESRTDPVAVSPNRIEKNRTEENRTEPDALARARPILNQFGITDEQINRSLELAPPLDIDDLPFMAESFVEYHRSKKTNPKNPYRTWLTWLKKDREFRAKDAPLPTVRSPSNGKLISDTPGWLEEQWEEARRYGS